MTVAMQDTGIYPKTQHYVVHMIHRVVIEACEIPLKYTVKNVLSFHIYETPSVHKLYITFLPR